MKCTQPAGRRGRLRSSPPRHLGARHRPPRAGGPALSVALLLLAVSCGDSCGPAGEGPIGVSDSSVRACDVLLRFDGSEIPKAFFGAAVLGEAVPKAPHLSLSFVARSDAPLSGESDLVSLRFEGASQAAELVRASCFDGSGARVDGEPLRFGAQ